MLEQHDVKKIEIVDKVAHITIKKDSLLAKEKYKELRYKSFPQVVNEGPHFRVNTGPTDLFVKKVEEIQKTFLKMKK